MLYYDAAILYRSSSEIKLCEATVSGFRSIQI
jgi:hypothetical protein